MAHPRGKGAKKENKILKKNRRTAGALRAAAFCVGAVFSVVFFLLWVLS
jgi:hypothetical protein